MPSPTSAPHDSIQSLHIFLNSKRAGRGGSSPPHWRQETLAQAMSFFGGKGKSKAKVEEGYSSHAPVARWPLVPAPGRAHRACRRTGCTSWCTARTTTRSTVSCCRGRTSTSPTAGTSTRTAFRCETCLRAQQGGFASLTASDAQSTVYISYH